MTKFSEPQALNRIASYCSKAERCEFDVRKKLLSWELSEESTNRIIKRLVDERFLSNERFCKSFVNDKMKFNKWGKTKIIYELRKRHIPESIYIPIIDDVSNNDFEKQLIHILTIKEKSVKAKDDYDKKNKLIRFALSRGFSIDLVIKCVNQIVRKDYEKDIP